MCRFVQYRDNSLGQNHGFRYFITSGESLFFFLVYMLLQVKIGNETVSSKSDTYPYLWAGSLLLCCIPGDRLAQAPAVCQSQDKPSLLTESEGTLSQTGPDCFPPWGTTKQEKEKKSAFSFHLLQIQMEQTGGKTQTKISHSTLAF